MSSAPPLNRVWGPFGLLSDWYLAPISGVKASGDATLVIHLHTVPWLRMRGDDLHPRKRVRLQLMAPNQVSAYN